MFKMSLIVFAGLLPFIPAIIYFLNQRLKNPSVLTRRLVLGLKGIHVLIAAAIAGFGLLWLASPQTVMAAGLTLQTPSADPYASLAAALATGVATLSAGIAVSNTGAAALGAIAERPETFGRALVFVGLSEGIGIYGLIIAVLILNR